LKTSIFLRGSNFPSFFLLFDLKFLFLGTSQHKGGRVKLDNLILEI
jgi:hypothetical protein